MIDTLTKIIKPNITIAFHTTLETWYEIHDIINSSYNIEKKVFSQNLLKDITSEEDRENRIKHTHERAHRNAKNNTLEIPETCFWLNIKNDVIRLTEIVAFVKRTNTNANRQNKFLQKTGRYRHTYTNGHI